MAMCFLLLCCLCQQVNHSIHAGCCLLELQTVRSAPVPTYTTNTVAMMLVSRLCMELYAACTDA